MNRPILAALLALSTVGAPALAAAPPAVPQARVAYSDLDLDSARGAKVMLHRIRLAAVDVCGSPAGRDSHEVLRFDACYQDAVSRAVAGLDRRLVTLAYEKRGSDRLYVRR